MSLSTTYTTACNPPGVIRHTAVADMAAHRNDSWTDHRRRARFCAGFIDHETDETEVMIHDPSDRPCRRRDLARHGASWPEASQVIWSVGVLVSVRDRRRFSTARSRDQSMAVCHSSTIFSSKEPGCQR